MSSAPGRVSLRLFAAAVIVAIAPTPAAAQRYSGKVVITAVEVPVQVVRNGEPVRGLTREDFVVLDRGVERKLIDFEVLDVLSLAPEGDEAMQPAGVAAADAPGIARGRHLLFLFDFHFSPDRRLALAVAGARRLVETSLVASDRVAVAIYSGSARANILVGFTGVRREIELGLSYVDALARRRPKEIRRAREDLVDYWTVVTGDAADGDGAERLRTLASRLGSSAAVALSGIDLSGDVMSEAEYVAISGAGDGRGAGGNSFTGLLGPRLFDDAAPEMEGLLSQIRAFSEAMTDLATLLRDVPHPKHLFLFSEGFPTRAFTNVEIRARAISRIKPGIRAMQAGGWAIQAIDIEGVPDSLAGSGRSATADVDSAATSFITGNARGDFRAQTGQGGFDAEALAYLSGETGGQVMENFNNVAKAGNRLLEATAVTYLLVFQPEDLKADGRYRRLDVRLAKPIPGARVLHRPGYVAPTAAAEAGETARRMDEARLVTGDQTVLDLAASSLVLAGPKARFLIELEAPELLADRSTGSFELEFQAYVFGSGDRLEQRLHRRLTFDLDRVGDRVHRRGLRLSGALDLPYGRHRVRLLLRDAAGERVFARSHVVESPVEVRRWASTPLFLDPAREALVLEILPADWGELGLPTSRFVPAASAALPPGGSRPFVFLFFTPETTRAKVSARILDGSDEPVDGAAVTWRERLPDAGDGGTRLLGTLDAGALAPGDYQVELTVDDGGTPIVRTRAFTVGH